MSTTDSSERPKTSILPTTYLSHDQTTDHVSKPAAGDNNKALTSSVNIAKPNALFRVLERFVPYLYPKVAQEPPLLSIPESSTDFACCCKGYHVGLIAEREIYTTHYRLEMGTIPLLDEANPMESAKQRASKDIMAAAESDLQLIVEEHDVHCTHSKVMASEMKEWSTYFPFIQRFP